MSARTCPHCGFHYDKDAEISKWLDCSIVKLKTFHLGNMKTRESYECGACNCTWDEMDAPDYALPIVMNKVPPKRGKK